MIEEKLIIFTKEDLKDSSYNKKTGDIRYEDFDAPLRLHQIAGVILYWDGGQTRIIKSNYDALRYITTIKNSE